MLIYSYIRLDHVTVIGMPIRTVELAMTSPSINTDSSLQSGEYHLTWSPFDLTQQEVASLYLAQADSWAMVDQFGM